MSGKSCRVRQRLAQPTCQPQPLVHLPGSAAPRPLRLETFHGGKGQCQSGAAAIKRHKGDLGKLIKNVDVKLIGHPVFNTKMDIITGLTIAINDTWAYKVSITSYELSGKRYKGSFNVTLYDHFGLDQPDVEKKYKYLAGFRDWFILQHLKRFAYKPFITEVAMTYSFEGQLA